MLEKKGLVKLTEECGELIQIASKKMTCMNSNKHWDGKGLLSSRMEKEIADVLASIVIVIENFNLNQETINRRADEKLELFRNWMNEEDKEV